MNLKELEALREKASEDKADLFDFYHDHWDDVIEDLTRTRFLAGTAVATWLGQHTAIGMVKVADLLPFLSAEFQIPMGKVMAAFGEGSRAA